MATIAPATAEDCLQLAEIQFDAFEPSIIHQRIFGNVSKENHSKHLAERFKKAIEKEGSEVFKGIITDEEGKEKIVGLAFWDRPKVKGQEDEEKKEEEGKTEEEKRAAMEKGFPEGTDYDLAISYFGRLDPKVDEPFYHLHLLAIDPNIQRTGAGTALLKWGCKQADKEGVASYLEASDVGVGLYRRYGYEKFAEPIIGGKENDLILYPMRRPPVELRTFRRSDFPALCQIYYEAFEPTTIWKYNFSNVTRQASDKCFKRRLEDWFDEVEGDGKTSEEKMEVIVAVRGEKVLGFSVWDKSPIKSERKEKEPSSQPFPQGANVERAKEYLGIIKEACQIDNKNWYLGLLAILTEAQGSGIGRLLTQWGIEKAREAKADVVLGSTEFGKPLYERLGFVDYGEPVKAPEDPSVINWPMILSYEKAE